MIGFLIALVSGALMSIQGVFNTQVTKSTGIWTASAFVQFTALLVCLGAWLCTERTSFLKIAQVEPRYMLLGGAIEAFITFQGTLSSWWTRITIAALLCFFIVLQSVLAMMKKKK